MQLQVMKWRIWYAIISLLYLCTFNASTSTSTSTHSSHSLVLVLREDEAEVEVVLFLSLLLLLLLLLFPNYTYYKETLKISVRYISWVSECKFHLLHFYLSKLRISLHRAETAVRSTVEWLLISVNSTSIFIFQNYEFPCTGLRQRCVHLLSDY